jgi:LysM repeat protein
MGMLDSVGNAIDRAADFVREVIDPPEPPPAQQQPPATAAPSGSNSGSSNTAGAGSGSGVSGPGSTASTSGAGNAVDNAVGDAVNRLDHDGDRVVMSVTAEGKLMIPVPTPAGGVPVGVGGKGQYGYDLTVQQVGGTGAADNTPAQYEVTFSKNLLAGAAVEPPVPVIDPAAELNFRTADSVTMRFDTPEDATRAVGILQRVAAEESLRDAASVAIPGASGGDNPASNPVGGEVTASGSGSSLPSVPNPASGPTGALSPATRSAVDAAADSIGPSDADTKWLEGRISSYSTTIGVQERAKLGIKLLQVGIEPRLDAFQDITRTVTLPQNGQDGRVSYTLGGELNLNSKEKVTIGAGIFDAADVGFSPQNLVDHGSVRGELSLSWDVPATAFGPDNSLPPELVALDGVRAPDQASARLQFQGQTQSLLDLTRTDQARGTFEATIDDPVGNGTDAINSLLRGDLQGAANTLGSAGTATVTAERIQRDGIRTQPEVGFEIADLFEAKASVITELGFDDVLSRNRISFDGTQPPPQIDTPPDVPEPPADNPDQFVVVPRDGLNVRAEPSTDASRNGVLYHGTFVEATGQRATDAQGREWIQVQGPDVDDQPVSGWVASEYLRPQATGGMDASGRVNPQLEAAGQHEYQVKQGDNLWQIAQDHGVPVQDVLDLNKDHLIDLSLVFPGDTVYLPGRDAPPAPPVPEAPQPAQPSEPSAPSAPSAPSPSTSGSDSGSGSGTPPATTAPQAPQPPTQADPTAGRRDLNEIREQYQVADEEMTTFHPDVDAPFGIPVSVDVPFVSQRATRTEAQLLDRLSLSELNGLKGLRDAAFSAANEAFPPPGGAEDFHGTNDGHNDAFRHTYASALMSREYGAQYAEALATAHEGVPDNPANREAMDLYNNQLGRQIAAQNPDASDSELRQLVKDAIGRGEALVIDSSGNLAWSDQVAVGAHGHPPESGDVLPGQIQANGNADPTGS